MYWIFILTIGYYHYPILKIRNWGTKGSLQNEWILKFNLQYPRIVRCAVLCLVAQSCPTLYDPMDCNLPGSSVLGILQAGMLEWVASPFSRESSQPRSTPGLLVTGRFLTIWATREAIFLFLFCYKCFLIFIVMLLRYSHRLKMDF